MGKLLSDYTTKNTASVQHYCYFIMAAHITSGGYVVDIQLRQDMRSTYINLLVIGLASHADTILNMVLVGVPPDLIHNGVEQARQSNCTEYKDKGHHLKVYLLSGKHVRVIKKLACPPTQDPFPQMRSRLSQNGWIPAGFSATYEKPHNVEKERWIAPIKS